MTAAKSPEPQSPDAPPSWAPPPATLELADDEAHVWRVDVPNAFDESVYRVLSGDERRKAAGLLFGADRRRFAAARAALRVLLGRYLRLPPESLVFGRNPHGKPFLVEDRGVRFSVSHSGDLALLAFARGMEVGVDVEAVREIPGLDGILARSFSPREAAALRSLPDGARETAFFSCWTRKEAFAKAKGLGLGLPFDRFTVAPTPGEPAALLDVEGNPSEPARWTLRDLDAAPGYAGALAIEGRDVRLARWQHTRIEAVRGSQHP